MSPRFGWSYLFAWVFAWLYALGGIGGGDDGRCDCIWGFAPHCVGSGLCCGVDAGGVAAGGGCRRGGNAMQSALPQGEAEGEEGGRLMKDGVAVAAMRER